MRRIFGYIPPAILNCIAANRPFILYILYDVLMKLIESTVV